MDIELIAFESMGVRSQATFIQTYSANIFIDPSAALAPRRFGLPPHIYEARKLLEKFDEIENLVKDSDIVVVTHYHYDHHDPGRFMDPDIYRGKVIYVKDPVNSINVSQKIRASIFLRIVSDRARTISIADGRSIELDKTRVNFSHPLPHGEEDTLGYIISVCIEDRDNVLLYTSDIEGGPTHHHKSLIDFCRKAGIAIVDGPPTYLLGYRYSDSSFRNSIRFLTDLINLDTLNIIILDHHMCRELDYTSKIDELLTETINKGKQITTAAQFMNIEPVFLEAKRRELFHIEPVDGLNMLSSRYRISNNDLGSLGDSL
ncbi:MAG: hypothetical protein QW101_00155 [Ignisphaera sp.]|uniref:UPF0282 protein ENT99_04250 n=1 Tax=Ignisphaera aggregans TaxID=334771 RepID=A0A7J3MXZ1_9CREN